MRDIAPHDAAVGLLTGMLLTPQVIPTIETTVMASDFESRDHGDMFLLLADMQQAGESIRDVSLVMSRMRQSGLMERLGGARQFQSEFLNVRAGENAKHYATQVRRFAVHRQLNKLASEFAARARTSEHPGELAEWMRFELSAIESRASADNHIKSIGQACTDLATDIRKTIASGLSPALPTGIDEFDDKYDGLFPSKLYIVAARPGGGKSSWSQQVGENISEANSGALFVSLEMSSDEFASRYLAKRTGINSKYLSSHIVGDSELRQVDESAKAAESVPFFISEPSGRHSTVEAICAEARVQKATRGIAVLIIDYLQIIEPSNPKQSEYEKVTLATRAFKQLSRELKIPVVLLSQLSRKGEGDGRKEASRVREPRLSDLRSSGSIEQDADCVIFLHDEGDGNVRFIVAKMRGAERHEATLKFHGPSCSFKSQPIADNPNFNQEFATHS